MKTSEQIIDTATVLLQQHGFNAFSYHKISEIIGIKTASIHYHFPTKHALGESVMKKYRRLHIEAMHNISSKHKSPLKKLLAFTDLFTCTLGNDYKMCPCAMLTTDISTLPESIKIEVQGFFIDSENWLTTILKEGIKKGELKFDGSAADCAKTLFASFEGAMLSARAFEDKNRLNKSLKQLVKFIQA